MTTQAGRLFDSQVLGFDKIGQSGSGPNGRWEEWEYVDTPWGESAEQNVLTNGARLRKSLEQED